MNTAFPAMAASFRVDPAHAATLLRRSVLAIGAILFVPALLMAGFAREVLTLWVGAGFAAEAAPVMRWLALAVLLGAADAVISGFIDSIGRPDVNARFSIAELVLYVPVLVALLHVGGIGGAAAAWTLRVGLDLAARAFIAARLVPHLRPILARMLCVIGAATVALALPLAATGVPGRVALMLVSLAAFGLSAWTWGVDAEEKAFCAGRLRFRAAA